MTPTPSREASPFSQNSDAAVLKVTGLSKTYPKTDAPALNALDLSVFQGEIFGLLGPNGAGKTTAIGVMSTLLRPSAGRVVICGLDLAEHSQRMRQVRRNIGVVPQHIALYENLSAKENLSYFGTLYGLRGYQLTEAVGDGLAMAGLTLRAADLVKTLSSGMKRRINLVAGALHRPQLLFLDEPTVGVDAQSRNLIFENLMQLKDQGMTMIYTTHYFEEAERLCSRIAILDNGQVIIQGPSAALVARHGDCANLSDLFLKLTGRQLRD